MRYLVIWRPDSGEEGGMPDPAHMAEMGQLSQEMMATGKLVATEPLTVRAAGARVRRTGERFTVGEETERAAGYAFLNAGSREEAIELCKTFLKSAGDGVCEMRQVLEFAPVAAAE